METTNTKNRSNSKFLFNRRKNSLAKRKPQNFSFVKENHGNMIIRKTEFGTYKCVMIVPTNGKGAFAYGRTFTKAYQNMIRNFNLKYTI